MDLISIKHFDDRGRLAGEHRFLGLFTSMAYSITASEIPLVRRKVARVINRTRFPPVSHKAKTLRHILENYPRDELFQISVEDLYRFALRTLELQLRPRLALLVRRDEEERFVSCMVYVPKDRHSTLLRIEIQKILARAFTGEVTAYYTRISDGPLAQLQFIVKTQPNTAGGVDVAAVEAELEEAVRSWSDGLIKVLGGASGQEAGLKIWRRYREAFPSAYQESFPATDGQRDIPIIERVLTTGELCLRLYRRPGAAARRYYFRTFEQATPAPLSRFLPTLENMGFQVNTESPFEVRPAGAPNPVWVREFELVAPDTSVGLEATPEDDLIVLRERFEDAFTRVWAGEAENDSFNLLVLSAGFSWRQVVVLRAYYKYLRQIGFAFSQEYVAQTLARNAAISRLLIELFDAHFDPRQQEGSEDATERTHGVVQKIQKALEGVKSRDEDRILWRFLNLVESTLRTNHFQESDGQPRPYLTFKLDGEKVRDLPPPRPMVETFVYSPRVEAVHLRGGRVARGGIRWSDRREDFRTEILGLLKSQMVKNAVIVPVGAKGGFVVKQPPESGDREALLREGVECYKTMIRALLELTDNRVGDAIVPPARVVCRDGEDPYLVVAADKGTATFSDIANSIAQEKDFWLGDAFASGGSVGYDHKKMAITARGAWESVKRHFREMDRDIQSQPFTVVGVGDMAGDVFGNGMLLSEHTRLVAAFNHLHIFVDPDPDPASSYAERRRLFELPRSRWSDYDERLLSEGGAVFDRQAKALTLSPQVRELLSLSDAAVTPDELLRAILRSKVDLLWFGGIGTFVKSQNETNGEVGDYSNDEVRVDARELGCRVIGEGANLGVTQSGRIEFALNGGRVNTDFIDNSGGVDCSDHEVNIKIVLDDAVASGDLTDSEREDLLASMSAEVADLVLLDNYHQTQSISTTQAQGLEVLGEHARLMRILEREGLLDRRLENLPYETTLRERRKNKKALTRPEIAVLLAYSKIYVLGELLESSLPDEPLLVDDLVRYFPAPMQDRFKSVIERHRLCREIIATHVTNSIINRVGPSFVVRLAEETGAQISDVARAYTAARDVFAMRQVWEEIELLDNKVPVDLQNKMWRISIELVERATRWFLRYGGRPLDVSACIDEFELEIVVVAAQLVDLLASRAKAKVRRRQRRLLDQGVPHELATRVAGMDILHTACDVARCSRESEVPVERFGKVYFAVGERFGFDRLRTAASRLGSESPWQQSAVTTNVEDLLSHQAQLARQVVNLPGKVKAAITLWAEERASAVRRLDRLLADFEAGPVDLAMLTVAERALRRLVSEP